MSLYTTIESICREVVTNSCDDRIMVCNVVGIDPLCVKLTDSLILQQNSTILSSQIQALLGDKKLKSGDAVLVLKIGGKYLILEKME